ncbi:MAG: hypothetical protein ACUVXI_14880 [bacterium]
MNSSNCGPRPNPRELLNKRTLILGEVKRGKTRITEGIVSDLLADGRKDIAIIDMAPDAIRGIGGKMRPSDSLCVRAGDVLPPPLYLTAKIHAPRLTGKSPQEVDAMAWENASTIEGLLRKYEEDPKEILVVNDISLYLQRGSLSRLLEVISLSQTLIANGYYGHTLGDDDLSQNERRNMDGLIKECDEVIWL